MADRLRLALIGCGMAAKPHAAALKSLTDRIEVAGVYARSPERRAAFAAEHGFPEAPSLDALVADPTIDAALVITPPNARADIVSAFARAGKHILSEKPLERTAEAAEAIVTICEAADVTLGVVFQHRFRKASEALADRLRDSSLGPIRVVGADIPWWREQAYYDEPGRGTYARDGGGVLISQAIHTLDLMLSLTGPAAELQGLTATTPLHRMEAEDYAAAVLRFANGAMGHLMASTAHYPGEAESLRLDCDRASVRLKSGVLDIHWRDGTHEQVGEQATTGGGADPMAFPSDWHRDLIADFAEAVRTGRAPRVTGRQALDVHRLIAAIERSSRDRRAISLPE
ncbi:Gfo/Idh/MocA family protein [Histidinibacterium lentulum]|uniref:Gfo/Idh/MocA family oxidoreductase n=1 Tax=Histidinibacterium lentulum TaxID=2480588 RepID=A0A3N2R8L4_9RHOB|nr:Gfo/Idh/MocA family oxidoreductase [Histidinibacterium lentulum]ROU03666.1 gfo/Idh/MocA family oxidoreductase [Histidinibacterium lentulum]